MQNRDNSVNILVIGCGGGGNNALNNMIETTDTHVRFLAVNTDYQAIESNKAENKILIASKNGKVGLGAGAKPEVGAKAAEDTLDKIQEHLVGTNMVFIASGLGGGTGTGAAPVIAKAAKEMGILTVGVVTKPFTWEGKRRAENAQKGLDALKGCTDALIEIPNDRVINISDNKTTVPEAFKMVDNVLKQAVFGVTELIEKAGYINLDFADVESILKDAGKSHIGVGVHKMSDNEDNAVLKATQKAIESPLLETSIRGARRIIVNYAANQDLNMVNISDSNNMIYEMVDSDVNFIFGNTTDATMPDGEVKVTVIAADFDEEMFEMPMDKPSMREAGTTVRQDIQATQERQSTFRRSSRLNIPSSFSSKERAYGNSRF